MQADQSNNQQRTAVATLTDSTPTDGSVCIQVIVTLRHQLVNLPPLQKPSVKLIVQDEGASEDDTLSYIAVFLQGGFAQHAAKLQTHDRLILAGFQIEPSGTRAQGHPFSLVLDTDMPTAYAKIFTVGITNQPRVLIVTPKSTQVFNNSSAASEGPARPNSSAEYEYTPISKVRQAESINLFGVVVYLKPPRPTRGTDWCLTFTLCDPGSEGEHPLMCNLFLPQHAFPEVQLGDIVRLHRIKIQTHNGSLQGLSSYGMSMVCFTNIPNAALTPRGMPNQTVSISHKDMQEIERLRSWVAHTKVVPQSTVTKRLCELEPDTTCSLVCQIYASGTAPNPAAVCAQLIIGDGTHPPPTCEITAFENSEITADKIPGYGLLHPGDATPLNNQGPRLELHVSRGNDIAIRAISKIAIRAISKTDPSVVSIFEEAEKSRCEFLARAEKAQLHLRAMQTRAMQTSCSLTEHDRQPLSTLRQVLTHPNVAHKFRCRVQVIAHFPQEIAQFSRRFCPHFSFQEFTAAVEAGANPETLPLGPNASIDYLCTACRASVANGAALPAMEYVYMFSLSLKDDTGLLEALVFGADAVKFLPGLPPRNLYENTGSQQALRNRMEKLLTKPSRAQDQAVPISVPLFGSALAQAIPEASVGWMDCCIMSYAPNPELPFARKYRLFDTTLLHQ
ncbi:hypothetical protein CAOG_05122 [Capsaspora owczarzaki ATCC 30864]|uniref:hypothetical protein n=1 Tax=Capsaspora owczarzaki (strain ATCC 30864) TaxID=595528 RepID=UPI0003526414|nr:hypothetical protein CAOG_05122 [Capsaspora owczarzaki ATCC 30864]|eukprot:XP_004346807.2 hypothetical protein CAOG_05122 [Capsaspora owczarzaki ATCC 30864]